LPLRTVAAEFTSPNTMQFYAGALIILAVVFAHPWLSRTMPVVSR